MERMEVDESSQSLSYDGDTRQSQNDEASNSEATDSSEYTKRRNSTPAEPEIIDLDLILEKETEVIDLVAANSKKKSALITDNRCINYDCASGLNLREAPLFCLIYYRVKVKNMKKQEICEECFEEVFKFNQKIGTHLVNGDLIFDQDFPVRDDLVEIVDSDEEKESETGQEETNDMNYLSSENLEFLSANLDDVLNEELNKCDIRKQITHSIDYLNKIAAKNKDNFENLDKIVNDMQKQVDSVRSELYSIFRKPTRETAELQIKDPIGTAASNPIITVHYIQPEPEPIKKNITPERRSHRNINKPATYAENDGAENYDMGIVETEQNPEADMPQTLEVVAPVRNELPKTGLPPKGPLVRPPPKVGDYYYAMKQSQFGVWGKVKLQEINPPHTKPENNEVTLYVVKFEGKSKSNMKTLNGKQLAYVTPSAVRLEVGTRVIAVFQDEGRRRDNYFSGIVAEPMSVYNNYRYLIFFDDGYAQYVSHNKVLVVVESSDNVWEDTHKDSTQFIKKYLQDYPLRAMVRLKPGHSLKTEWSSKWWSTSVVKVDCSLVQLFFEADGRTEWIYRGSARLGPLFSELQAATSRLEKSANIRRSVQNQKKNLPFVEYTRSGGAETEVETEFQAGSEITAGSTTTPTEQNQPAAPPRAVAKKSTARLPTSIPPKPALPTNPIPFLPQQVLQPQSKVVYFTPKAPIAPVEYKPHHCSVECKKFVTRQLSALKGYNPLSKPLLCGWHRLLYKYKGKKLIRYRSPCGRSVRNMSELHRYLRTTESDMSVDMFDFDYWIHCLAEFVLDKTFRSRKDISNGQENVPIPCVNYVDNTLPDFCNYSTKREPMEGVNLNLDPEFLCGCDCEDDCADKSKCQCWQLTIREHRSLNKRVPDELVGYVYKRLPEFVTTGIYECNSRCKCAATCLNRVVQHPLQLKLQLFKTANRGWGIRGLNDIPQGAFICIYAGSLLTDKMANEGGVNYGDEYLAELDYIEVVEKQKDGYESDVEDIENQSEQSKDEEEEEEDTYPFNQRTTFAEDDQEYVCEFNIRTPTGNSSIRTRSKRQTGESDTDRHIEEESMDVSDEQNRNMGDEETAEEETVTISDDEEVAIREPSSFDPSAETEMDVKPNIVPKFKSVRKLFGEDEVCYIMDAKNTGNIGRYLNHSCNPNVFVQNVFVDTHDLRFPWVAFFAMSYIRAGTELTWNYNYDVGSVPGKVIFCHCGSTECRGRLL